MSRLTSYEVATLSAFLIETMHHDTRARFMREFPTLWNKLVGRQVMASVLLCLCGRVPEGCVCADRDPDAEDARPVAPIATTNAA